VYRHSQQMTWQEFALISSQKEIQAQSHSVGKVEGAVTQPAADDQAII